jgi:hypothetical protein
LGAQSRSVYKHNGAQGRVVSIRPSIDRFLLWKIL